MRSGPDPQELCSDVAITTDDLARLVNRGIFTTLEIGLQAEQVPYSVHLFLRPIGHSKQEGFPISGFPQHTSHPSINHVHDSSHPTDGAPSRKPTIVSRTLSDPSSAVRASSRGHSYSSQSVNSTHLPAATTSLPPCNSSKRRNGQGPSGSHDLDISPACLTSDQTPSTMEAWHQSKPYFIPMTSDRSQLSTN